MKNMKNIYRWLWNWTYRNGNQVIRNIFDGLGHEKCRGIWDNTLFHPIPPQIPPFFFHPPRYYIFYFTLEIPVFTIYFPDGNFFLEHPHENLFSSTHTLVPFPPLTRWNGRMNMIGREKRRDGVPTFLQCRSAKNLNLVIF